MLRRQTAAPLLAVIFLLLVQTQARTVAPVDSTLIPAGAVWKYNDSGTNLGTAWRDPGYGDGGWASGPAQLGYGDLVETMLDLVPPSRVADTIYINPADTAYPFALNPIDSTTGLSASLMASALLSVLKKAWPDFWGPA